MTSNASRIRTYRLPSGNAARATRAVSSGIGSGFRACNDIVASNPSDSPALRGMPYSRPQMLCRLLKAVTEFATSISFGEASGTQGAAWLASGIDVPIGGQWRLADAAVEPIV